jgi:hypothetical protein
MAKWVLSTMSWMDGTLRIESIGYSLKLNDIYNGV